jgi:hypothetical protein
MLGDGDVDESSTIVLEVTRTKSSETSPWARRFW